MGDKDLYREISVAQGLNRKSPFLLGPSIVWPGYCINAYCSGLGSAPFPSGLGAPGIFPTPLHSS